jgi:hypothetical protein
MGLRKFAKHANHGWCSSRTVNLGVARGRCDLPVLPQESNSMKKLFAVMPFAISSAQAQGANYIHSCPAQ